jgi:multiple sugar transport system substrate-binding protein
MRRRMGLWWMSVGVVLSTLAWTTGGVRAETTITMWSHYADHQGVRNVFEEIVRRFETNNPGVKLKVSFYEKNALFAAQSTSLRAGRGPDILYWEPEFPEYVESNLLLPLNDRVELSRYVPWAKEAVTFNGKVVSFPVQAYSNELYYNKGLMRKVGVELPPSKQPSQDAFLDIVKKGVAAGIVPIVQGIGDRPYPGAYVTQELLLRRLGKTDYRNLWTGQQSFKDPRVVAVFEYVKQLIDAGAYPKSFSSLKLGESHIYFHTKPGGLMFPVGSWYTSRAFNPPDKGGQPDEFELGIMHFPAMRDGACNKCKTVSVGGSYAINAQSPNADLAAKVFKEMATEEIATLWLANTYVSYGMKSDPSKITGKHSSYFRDYAEINAGLDTFLGAPLDIARGKCRDAFTQVMNSAFPSGVIGVRDAVQIMDQGCFKG